MGWKIATPGEMVGEIVKRLTHNSESLDVLNDALSKFGERLFSERFSAQIDLSVVRNQGCEIGNMINEFA